MRSTPSFRQPARVAAWIRAPWAGQIGPAALGAGVGIAVGVVVAAAGPLGPLYIAAGMAGLALGLAMLLSTQVGLLTFVGVATLLPFAVIPVPLGTFKLTLIDVTLTILLIVWLARLLLQRDERLQITGLEGYVALFVGLAAFSFLLGTGTTAEMTRLFLKMINSVLLFFTAANCVRTSQQLGRIVTGLIAGAGGAAGLGIALYVLPAGTSARLLSALAPLGYPSGADVLRYLPSTTTLRAIATSVDPNIYGAMLMVAAVLGFSQVLSPRPVLDRRLVVGLTGAILVALLLSYSRGSWVGAVAGVLFIVTLRHRRAWLLVALAGALLALGLLPSLGFLPGLGGFVEHLQSGFEARDQAAAMRLGEYKDAFRLIEQYPWFGVGFGVAPDVDLYIGVSSIYLLLAEQMGLVGLGAYLLAVGTVLWRALRVLLVERPEPEVDALLLGTTAALVAALTAGVFDHHFVNLLFPHVVGLFWLLAGLTMVGVRLARRGREAEPEAESS